MLTERLKEKKCTLDLKADFQGQVDGLWEKIKELEQLKSYFLSESKRGAKSLENFIRTIKSPFSSVIDSVLISITFENYFKSILLINNIVIHEIDRSIDLNLSNRQRKFPISKSELTIKDGKYLQLKKTTINYSLLLKKKNYYNFFNIDSDLREYLIKINDYRNTLHLNLSIDFTISKKEIENLELLKSIVETDFGVLFEIISQRMPGESRTKIPIKHSI